MKIDTLKKYIHPIHEEGYIFIGIFFAITLVLYGFSDFLGNLGLILSFWCIYFFRDPKRHVPQIEGALVSAADGLVSSIDRATPPAELGFDEDVKLVRISTFLSVIDVHVNRTPVAGNIKKAAYHPGKFLSAELDKSSDENERNSLVIEDKNGETFVVTQIAGLIARRIKCTVKEGEELDKGDRIGIIRFGSRVDVYLPDSYHPRVAIGQRVIGGETLIASKGEALDIETKII